MAKRISDIAKELGIPSKVIIDKCLAEGIPADKVKGHMSTLSVGLEATIREWFASSGPSTAVETTAHVDVETVRAAPKRPSRTKGKSADGSGSSGDDTGVATEAPPSTTSKAPPRRRPPSRTESAPSADDSGNNQPATVEPKPALTPSTLASPSGPAVVAPAAAATVAPSRSSAPETHADDDEPRTAPTPHAAPLRPAASAPVATPPGAGSTGQGPSQAGPGAGHGPGHGPSQGPGPQAPARPGVRPAPMNVPVRPTVVSPAGPKLVEKQQVKLSGPRVVRIEAPEVINKPRPRREGYPDSGPMGPRGPEGPGRSGGGESGGSDEGRAPRRNTTAGAAAGKRRTDTDPSRGGVPARRRGLSGGSEEMHSGMWREQDLAEREARLSRAAGYLKQRRQHAKKLGLGTPGERAQTAAQTGGGEVHITAPFTIKDLSAATGVKAADVIKRLFMQGVMATVNSGIDPEKAQEIMMDFDIELVVEAQKTAEETVKIAFEKREGQDVRARGPIVTILGHVDHGKTSLLDKIRNANVAAGEAGGITQKASAFRTPVVINGETKHILFMDTPGHEAFTAMRARGAAITDVVVLVVSAPEGVMPQTIESINHAKAANVPIVVALNKIDRPDATEAKINQTLGELAKAGLNPLEWGGETEVIRTSATKGTGIDKLLEVLDLQGQLLELKADYAGPARGTVVDARVVEGRGPVADVIVQDGELKVGDFIVVGRAFGKVRDITDDRSERHKSLGPCTVARMSGFDTLPDAGDKFYIVDSLKKAQEAAEQRRQRDREADLSKPKVTLDSLLSQMKESELKEILVVLKADVQGSVDVLKNEIERVKTDEVKARVLHAAVGGITESDVILADASRAVIIGFNVIASSKARQLAEAKSVEVRTYQVIYEITDDIKKAAEGLLSPEQKTQILGHAEVRQVFRISKVGTIAGCYVTDGIVQRDAFIRVTRNGVVIENNRVLEQLKRFKDDAKEVKANMECGMKIVGYDDIKEGDVLECYKTVEVKRTL